MKNVCSLDDSIGDKVEASVKKRIDYLEIASN